MSKVSPSTQLRRCRHASKKSATKIRGVPSILFPFVTEMKRQQIQKEEEEDGGSTAVRMIRKTNQGQETFGVFLSDRRYVSSLVMITSGKGGPVVRRQRLFLLPGLLMVMSLPLLRV